MFFNFFTFIQVSYLYEMYFLTTCLKNLNLDIVQSIDDLVFATLCCLFLKKPKSTFLITEQLLGTIAPGV